MEIIKNLFSFTKKKDKNLSFGVAFALIACACWAFAFVVPIFLSEYSASDIAMSRYFIYGLLSLLYYIVINKNKSHENIKIWMVAFVFACSSQTLYFYMLIKGMQFVGPEISIAVIGLMPITVAISGNIFSKEYSMRNLIGPIFLTLVGIIVLYYFKVFSNNEVINTSVVGLLYCVAALLLWTFYGSTNAVFLKKNEHIRADIWSSMIGIMCFIQVLIWKALQFYSGEESKINFDNFSELIILASWATALAIIPSWLATAFWNKSSRLIPTFLAGQLIIFETIIAFFYVFIVYQSLPKGMEVLGISIMLVGIYFTIRAKKYEPLDNSNKVKPSC